MIRLLCFCGLLAALAPAWSAQWRVDLIVFADRDHAYFDAGDVRIAPSAELPGDAIPLEDSARLSAAGIRVLAPGDTVLSRQWSRLANSQRFEPGLRLSWLQDDPPPRGGPRLLLRHGPEMPVAGSTQRVHRLQGSLRLTLRRFLHLDTDLQWTDEGADGLHATRLKEQRRMRSETLHHLDTPRFGVLAHILKVGDEP